MNQNVKKALSLALAAVLAMAVLAGCSGQSGAAAKKTATVTVMFEGASVTNDTEVVDAINKRLSELGLGNISFKPEWGTWGDFNDKAKLALDTGNANIDIFFTCGWTANAYVPYTNKGAYLRLDDPSTELPEDQRDLLAQYGKDMKAAIPQMLWDGFTIDGPSGRGVYGVPGYKDYAQSYAWVVNNTRLQELGFDFDSFAWNADTLFDPKFEEAMAAAKAQYGDSFYPLLIETEATARRLSNMDGDITSLGVIPLAFDAIDPSKPVNPSPVTSSFENPLYLKVLAKFNEFYEKGYMDPRTAIKDESSVIHSDAVMNGTTESYLFGTISYAYGHENVISAATGKDIRMPLISTPIVSTSTTQGAGFAVSTYSKNPVEAVQFLNAWMSDAQLMTLLMYGVEGVHYNKNANGSITKTDKGNAEYGTWLNGMGNTFLTPSNNADNPNEKTDALAFYKTGVPTTFLGFVFDSTPVETEMAALSNVMAEYDIAWYNGIKSPDEVGPELKAKLDANGFQKLLDELNKQLNAFYATK